MCDMALAFELQEKTGGISNNEKSGKCQAGFKARYHSLIKNYQRLCMTKEEVENDS
jgi:hypothetical protein